jgi:membrane protein required for colicin V production
MVIDILIICPMIVFTLLGFRDGVVRKLVAIVFLIIGLFLGQLYMYDFGQFLSDNGWIHSDNSSMYGFLYIFLAAAILQGLLYKILTGGYKIGGFADRVGGIILGFIEGALFLSCLLFIFALTGFPSREIKRDARLYKPIVNIAPQILDLTSSLGPDSFEKLKEIGNIHAIERNEKVPSIHQSIDSSAVLNKRKQFEKADSIREALRKNNP